MLTDGPRQTQTPFCLWERSGEEVFGLPRWCFCHQTWHFLFLPELHSEGCVLHCGGKNTEQRGQQGSQRNDKSTSVTLGTCLLWCESVWAGFTLCAAAADRRTTASEERWMRCSNRTLRCLPRFFVSSAISIQRPRLFPQASCPKVNSVLSNHFQMRPSVWRAPSF